MYNCLPLIDIDLKTLSSELAEVKNKWYEIGVQLGIKASTLDTFKVENETVSMYLSATLHYWLDGNTTVPVCWESIVSALRDPFVNEAGQGKRLQRKFCEVPQQGGYIISL